MSAVQYLLNRIRSHDLHSISPDVQYDPPHSSFPAFPIMSRHLSAAPGASARSSTKTATRFAAILRNVALADDAMAADKERPTCQGFRDPERDGRDRQGLNLHASADGWASTRFKGDSIMNEKSFSVPWRLEADTRPRSEHDIRAHWVERPT
jgi:hypothetical protein